MTDWLTPVTLAGECVRLEPLSADHHDALCDSVRDGELWRLWFTAIPEPAGMREKSSDASASRNEACARSP